MEINYSKRRKKRIDQAIFWVMIGLFIVPIFVREMIIPNFYQLNIFAFFGCCLVLYYTLPHGKLKQRDFITYILIVILTCILIVSEMHAGRTIKGFIRVFGGLIMPLPLLYYRMRNPEKTIRVVLNIFKVVSLIVVVMGVIDLLTDSNLIVNYYMFANDYNYADMAMTSTRLYSYIGHPLYNAELFLMTFGMNYAYNEIFLQDHKQDKWIIILTMIGIAMTASKSAIAIFLGLLIILYIKNIKYMLFSLIILAIGYYKGLFDQVILRFSGSLSTGRNEVWERISSKGIDFFHFFWGNGSDSKYSYSYLEEWARAAFEYPYKLYALEFGILFTIIIFLFLFLLPEIRIINNGKKWIMFSAIFLGVTIHVNMYNGIGTYSDPMYLYCLFGCMILNMSTLSVERTKI